MSQVPRFERGMNDGPTCPVYCSDCQSITNTRCAKCHPETFTTDEWQAVHDAHWGHPNPAIAARAKAALERFRPCEPVLSIPDLIENWLQQRSLDSRRALWRALKASGSTYQHNGQFYRAYGNQSDTVMHPIVVC